MSETASSTPRRECFTKLAIDPADGKCAYSVEISHKRAFTVARRSMGQAKETAFLVPYALEAPTAIFEGLRRDTDEDHTGCGWRCYCTVPKKSFAADGQEKPPYPDQVFLVFINDKGVAYNWRWEKADDSNKNFPVDYKTRFREKLL